MKLLKKVTVHNILLDILIYLLSYYTFLIFSLFFLGIETATLDLQKENEERLWQEGILRHVPVVGTFVNWWSPRRYVYEIQIRKMFFH